MIMKEIDYEQIGKRIRAVRMSKELTQDYLSFHAGIDPSHISNIERNKTKVSLTALVGICNALDVSVDYILANTYTDPATALENQMMVEYRKCSLDMKERILKIVQALQ